MDNGGGIDNDILSHVSEPYYTTKYNSKGIGLYMPGMINCKNIYYRIKNRPFVNCTLFTITIPVNKDLDDFSKSEYS